MAIARPTKREIKIDANQRKELELDFVGIVTGFFFMPKVVTRFGQETGCFLCD